MQIRQLLTFVTVARTKNMAQAALTLNYSHSTIYGHLESLEKEFNVKFYNRTSHGIELTEQGNIFLGYAKQFVELYYEMTEAFSEQVQSSIRIGATEASDVCIMRHILRNYIQRVPNVAIEYAKMTVDISLNRLTAGTCDLAIISEFNYQPADVYAQYLCTFPLIFVTSPVYLAKNYIQQRSRFNLLGTMKISVACQMLEDMGQHYEDYFYKLTNIGDLDTIKQQLFYHQGVAVLPEPYVEQDLKENNLVRIPTLPGETYLDVFLVSSSKSRIGPHTKALIDLAYERYNPQHLKEGNILRTFFPY